MSVSAQTKPSLAALQKQEDRELETAQTRHTAVSTLLAALPPDTPVPSSVNNFGYCAQASMNFEGSGLVQRLLALYPPLPLVDVTDGSRSQKPRKYLRDNEERGMVVDIHPVLLKYEGGKDRRPSPAAARWWTTIAEQDVEIVVKGASKAELGLDDARYNPYAHTYATGSCSFFVRKVAEVTGRLDALELWQQSWSEFADKHGHALAARHFVMAVRARVEREPEVTVTLADLPEPNYLQLGALEIPEGVDLTATLAALADKQKNRSVHQWDRIGDFHRLFTPTQVDELLTFANERAGQFRAAVTQAEEEFAQVQAWLTDFFGSRGPVLDSEYDFARYVEQLCRKATGLAVNLGVGGRGMKEVSVSARIGNNRDTGRHLSLACNPELPALRPQDLPVDYA